MTRRPDTPQLPLDFDASHTAESTVAPATHSNVVRLVVGYFRPKVVEPERPPPEVDSVLQEVLSNAKRLNW
jgi:hypothetical protein